MYNGKKSKHGIEEALLRSISNGEQACYSHLLIQKERGSEKCQFCLLHFSIRL